MALRKIPDEDTINFGTLLREVRTANAFTQKDLANLCNISLAAYTLYDKGQKFPSEHIETLIHVFGDKIADFFPYDIRYYTSHRLFTYSVLFDIKRKDIAMKFGLTTKQLKALFSENQVLPQYKKEFDELFPKLHDVPIGSDMIPIGYNSYYMCCDNAYYIYPNLTNTKKKTDNPFTLMNQIKNKEKLRGFISRTYYPQMK